VLAAWPRPARQTAPTPTAPCGGCGPWSRWAMTVPASPVPSTSPHGSSGGASAARLAPSPSPSPPPPARPRAPGGTKPPPPTPPPGGGPAPGARRPAARHDWPAGAGLEEDLLDTPGYRPWCRYRTATGTGTAPDFSPARPRPLHVKEIA